MKLRKLAGFLTLTLALQCVTPMGVYATDAGGGVKPPLDAVTQSRQRNLGQPSPALPLRSRMPGSAEGER